MYLLDTNVCIEVINGRPQQVGERFASVVMAGTEVCVSSVSVFELSYGVEKSSRREVNARQLETFLSGAMQVLAFEQSDAARTGEVWALLEKLGTPIGPYDLLIAGQALARGLVVVTANLREFSRVPGLRVESWR
jgi:tRNA(fMet)-specific endonuclease VapC